MKKSLDFITYIQNLTIEVSKMSETYWAGEECLKFKEHDRRMLCLYARLDELLELMQLEADKDTSDVIMLAKHIISGAIFDDYHISVYNLQLLQKKIETLCEQNEKMKKLCEENRQRADTDETMLNLLDIKKKERD